MPGTLTLGGMSAGLASGEKIIGPVTTVGSNTVGGITDASLSSGDNTFAVPLGAVAVAVFLGQSPATTVKIRTNLNVADAGLPLTPVGGIGWAKFDLPTGTTEIILNSSGSLPGGELSFI